MKLTLKQISRGYSIIDRLIEVRTLDEMVAISDIAEDYATDLIDEYSTGTDEFGNDNLYDTFRTLDGALTDFTVAINFKKDCLADGRGDYNKMFFESIQAFSGFLKWQESFHRGEIVSVLTTEEVDQARVLIDALIKAKTSSDVDRVHKLEEEFIQSIEKNHNIDPNSDDYIDGYNPELGSAYASLGESISFKDSYIRYGESEDDYYPYLEDFIRFIDSQTQ